MQYNIHEAKTHFSRLLEQVGQGESVIIAKNGIPIAEIVPYQRKGIELGAGTGDPLINDAALAGDEWWEGMTAQEADEFIAGR